MELAFYLLLIIPHLLACGGLFWWASRVQPGSTAESGAGGAEGSDGGGGSEPPFQPQPVGPSGGLPLVLDGIPPARRLRVGENLADLHPPRPRRDHEPAPAPRVPVAP